MNDLRSLIIRAKQKDSFWVETAILEVTEDIVDRMDDLDISKSDLAARLGKTPAFVTKLLRGNNNFTLETVVKIARRLGCRYRGRLEPETGSLAAAVDFVSYKQGKISAITLRNEKPEDGKIIYARGCFQGLTPKSAEVVEDVA